VISRPPMNEISFTNLLIKAENVCNRFADTFTRARVCTCARKILYDRFELHENLCFLYTIELTRFLEKYVKQKNKK
jgi:hypothetical protein